MDTSSSYGNSVVGTVSGTTISFGTPVVIAPGTNTSFFSSAFDSTNGKVVIAYHDYYNSSAGTAVVGTVSGSSISFGTPVVFDTGPANFFMLAFDSNSGKVVVAYPGGGSGYGNNGTVAVGTVSGSSISFGTPVTWNTSYSTLTTDKGIVFDSTNNKMVIVYTDSTNSGYGTVVIGTVSGTSMTFGTPVVFNSAYTVSSAVTFDSTNSKVVIVYRDGGNANASTAIVSTVSGTSISLGSPVVFDTQIQPQYFSPVFDPTSGKVNIFWTPSSAAAAFIIEGTVSGTSISFSERTEVAAGAFINTMAFDSTTDQLIATYRDGNNSGYGTAVTITPS
tara:strand:+ start:587 stop:1588 length:1002 start_codon:yes stop_codon:yes gene_type:complete